jgi:multicomponent K+:H+ antiporter subunit C
MELIVASGIGVVAACGIYLLLRARTFAVVLGLSLLAYAVNFFIFVMGRLTVNGAPVIGAAAGHADPLPQALVLTAIVIGFGMTAYVVAIAVRAHDETGSDHVDGDEPRRPPEDGAP